MIDRREAGGEREDVMGDRGDVERAKCSSVPGTYRIVAVIVFVSFVYLFLLLF